MPQHSRKLFLTSRTEVISIASTTKKMWRLKPVGDYVGTLVGHGSKFFIVVKNGFYDLYDMQGHKYKSISTTVGDIVSVSGDTFVVRKNGYTTVYNSKGEKIKQ